MFQMIRTKQRFTDGEGDTRLGGVFHITALSDLDADEPRAELTRVMSAEGDGELGEKEWLPVDFVLDQFERCDLVSVEPSQSLDARMKAAGMIPLSELLNNPGVVGPFAVHAGVTDLETYYQWLEMRYEESAKSRVSMELDKKTDDEMFEWILSHQAAFGEALANFKAATGR
jgi:hypothetical protein